VNDVCTRFIWHTICRSVLFYLLESFCSTLLWERRAGSRAGWVPAADGSLGATHSERAVPPLIPCPVGLIHPLSRKKKESIIFCSTEYKYYRYLVHTSTSTYQDLAGIEWGERHVSCCYYF
jgi:hypothetical protein